MDLPHGSNGDRTFAFAFHELPRGQFHGILATPKGMLSKYPSLFDDYF